MKTKIALLAAAAAVCFTAVTANAQPQRDYRDNSYQNETREEWRREQERQQYREDRREQRRDERRYYRQGAYEQNCRSGSNQTAGTIFGALAGGLLGAGVSNGNGGAAIGGAVLGGVLGNVISKDIDCNDQPYAFNVYTNGLNGPVGRRHDWNRGQNRGYFTPVREYRRSGIVCRPRDGHWHFD